MARIPDAFIDDLERRLDKPGAAEGRRVAHGIALAVQGALSCGEAAHAVKEALAKLPAGQVEGPATDPAPPPEGTVPPLPPDAFGTESAGRETRHGLAELGPSSPDCSPQNRPRTRQAYSRIWSGPCSYFTPFSAFRTTKKHSRHSRTSPDLRPLVVLQSSSSLPRPLWHRPPGPGTVPRPIHLSPPSFFAGVPCVEPRRALAPPTL